MPCIAYCRIPVLPSCGADIEQPRVSVREMKSQEGGACEQLIVRHIRFVDKVLFPHN